MAELSQVAERARRVFKKLGQDTESQTARMTGTGFNPFDQDDIKAAALMSLEFAIRADTEDDAADAISAVLDAAEEQVEHAPEAMVAHALSLFATHTETGRHLRKPRLMEAQPSAVLPGRSRSAELEAASGVEGRLDYWRENAFANEHHQHWHEVYPGIGVQIPLADFPPAILNKIQVSGPNSLTRDELRQLFRRQDRHGELFVYMHQQMLARYDAERLSNGLDPVVALTDGGLTTPIPEGFEPGEALSPPFDGRPEGLALPGGAAAQLQGWHDEIAAAIAAGAFTNTDGTTTAITATGLGDQIEAVHDIHRGDVDQQRYGNLHNSGHGTISAVPPTGTGVMASTATAIRDPIFYRWHKVVDDLAFSWQETQPTIDFADAPPVTFAGGDQLWSASGIVLIDEGDTPIASAAIEEALGGANWGSAPLPGVLTTSGGESFQVLDTLTTRMDFADLPDPAGGTAPVEYLRHDPFAYALMLHNPSTTDAQVTVRLFLCPASHSDDRRFWIEMDKFPATIPSGAQSVVLRRDTLSSVVKKPAEPLFHADLVADADGDPRCDCGWPYTLLLPRGTEAGMEFHLMAMVTDAALDLVAPSGTCGSLSFCGARDDVYPDRRDMGYPFHRRWPGPIGTTAAATSSMAGRGVTIRHLPFGS